MGEKRELLNGSKAKNKGYGSVKYGLLENEQHPSSQHSRDNVPRCHFTRRDFIIVAVVLLVATVAISVTLSLGLPKIREKKIKYYNFTQPISESLLTEFTEAAAVADGKPCGEIGKAILQKGGSAVDSVIAMLFCDGVVNPQSMGLGGGFFMVVYDKNTKKASVFDARETAPKNSSVDMFKGNSSLSSLGGLSIGVPGELKGYWDAHQAHGKLTWSELVGPSIKLCREGFEVGFHLASKLAKKESLMRKMSPDLIQLFTNNETNQLYKEGDIMKRPVLARTLETISRDGANAFYSGEIGEKLVGDIKSCGGIITMEDLNNYKVEFKDALHVKLQSGYTLHSVPPPGSGGILAFILNILDGFNFTSESVSSNEKTVETYHKIIEAFKHAYSARTHFGDEKFVPVQELLQNITSLEFAEAIRQHISADRTFDPEYYGVYFDTPEDKGTAHVQVLAPNGDAASATSTVNTLFGSMCYSKSTGIILNSDMDDFSFPNITNYFGVSPSEANYLVPGKRPLSSMAPAILVNGSEVHMVIGGAGGTRITTASAFVIAQVLWLGKNIKEAIDTQRFHHQLYPNIVQHEKDFPQLYIDKLQRYGHKLKVDPEGSVVLGIIREQNGKIYANVDHRKGGDAEGY